MDTQLILDYLVQLSVNNEREWFHTHKALYEEANREFENLLEQLIKVLGETEPELLRHKPKDLTFKLQRDTRFSLDKTPYNPAFRAHISAAGKQPVPVGLYVAIKPYDKSFLGGGLFVDCFSGATESIRRHIEKNGEQWRDIIDAPEFKKRFTIKGTVLKNTPRGFSGDEPDIEHIKYKNWYIEYNVSDDEIAETGFVQSAAETLTLMRPFNAFLNSALEGCDMLVKP